jgi:HAD superfamily hydrolase (TIGR01509 family)
MFRYAPYPQAQERTMAAKKSIIASPISSPSRLLSSSSATSPSANYMYKNSTSTNVKSKSNTSNISSSKSKSNHTRTISNPFQLGLNFGNKSLSTIKSLIPFSVASSIPPKQKEIVLVFDLDLTLYNSTDFVSHRSPSVYYKSFTQKQMLAELLHRLPFRKYILTNASHSHAVTVSKSLGIQECFKGILSMDMYNLSKPDPRIYTLACSLFSLNPAEHDIWFFEDQHINLKPAKEKFGWHTVYIYDDTDPKNNRMAKLPPYIDMQFGRIEHALSFLFHKYFTKQ